MVMLSTLRQEQQHATTLLSQMLKMANAVSFN